MAWICGAPGAGKSVAAWGLFEELAASGQRVAYVDIDQLGMLYPETDVDPGRHVLKAQALRALIPGYAAAGAQALIVSGVVDPQAGPRSVLGADADLALYMLSPGPDVLRERIAARGWDEAEVMEAVAEDAVLQGSNFMDMVIATAGLSVSDTVSRLRNVVRVGASPVEAPRSRTWSTAAVPVVVITGPRVVGSSTVGFGLAMGRWRDGHATAFVDLQQLGFISTSDRRTATEVSLAINQLAVVHALMAQQGSELLLVSAHLTVEDRATLRAALPQARVTVVRLRSDRQTFADHVRARVEGNGARLAGDDILGADKRYQDRVVAAALADQGILDAAAADDVVLDVSGRTPAEVQAELQLPGR